MPTFPTPAAGRGGGGGPGGRGIPGGGGLGQPRLGQQQRPIRQQVNGGGGGGTLAQSPRGESLWGGMIDDDDDHDLYTHSSLFGGGGTRDLPPNGVTTTALERENDATDMSMFQLPPPDETSISTLMVRMLFTFLLSFAV
jgi:hypothetical protein